jgi:hypothetical protein
LDDDGRLLIVPALGPDEDFALIYRAGMEIEWRPAQRALSSPRLRPGGWSYSDWFQQILRAASAEYGTTLSISDATTWSVPEEVRRQIDLGRGAN